MGLFSKIKNIFSRQEEVKEKLDNDEIKINKEQKEEIIKTEKYVDGLSKTRKEFVNKLSLLGIKYTKVTDEFYDELEEILITADIGVNTVMNFVDRLKKRVKTENIEDFEYLKEVIVDELFTIYVNDEILTTKLNVKDNELNVILFVGVNGVKRLNFQSKTVENGDGVCLDAATI